MRRVKYIVLIIVFNSAGVQAKSEDVKNLHALMQVSFKTENYKETKRIAESLIDVNYDTTAVNFYLGASLIALNESPYKAQEYLYKAAAVNYNKESHLYLALAYYRMYELGKAEISFKNYSFLAGKREEKKVGLQESLENIKKLSSLIGKEVVAYEYSLKQNLSFDSVLLALKKENSLNLRELNKSGKHMSPNFNLITVIINGDDEYFFYFSPAKNKSHFDIFITKRLSDTSFSDPITLNEINTSANEINPYYDSVNNILYYASDGTNGLGAYDIYAVELNADFETKEAIEIKFPLNTPFNELVYAPIKEEEILISDRTSTETKLDFYKLKRTDGVVNIASSKDYEKASQFSPIAEKAKKKNKKKKKQTEPAPVSIIEDSLPKPLTANPAFNTYDSLLLIAMTEQLKADSIESLVKIKLVERDTITDKDLRTRATNGIVRMNKMKDYHTAMAHKHFLLAEGKNAPKVLAPSSLDPKLKVWRREGGITFYEFPVEKNQVVEDSNKKAIAAPVKEQKITVMKENYVKADSILNFETNLTEGLLYRIQLGVYSRNLSIEEFNGVQQVYEQELLGRGLVKYYAGDFRKISLAKENLEEVKFRGFPDAFIVAFNKKMSISLEEAKSIEFRSLNEIVR